MAYATDTFTGDGSTVEFTLTFKFIQRNHVEVYRVVTATKAKTKLTVIASGTPTGDQFVWVNDEKIKVGTAPTAAQQIEVVRDTPEDQQIVDWKDGSYIVASDLNTSDKQWLYGIQELEDQIDAIDGGTSGPAVKEITGTAPITVDSTDPQKPGISVDTINKADAVKDPTNPSWDTDDKLATPAAIDRIYSQIVGDGAGFPGSGNKAKLGQLRIDNTGSLPKMYFWDTGSTSWVEVKNKGDKGDPGPPPGLQSPAASASNVPLNMDGSLGTATATVSQDSGKDLKFDFGIPVGQKGQKGDKGDKGEAGQGVSYKGQINAITAPEPTGPKGGDFYLSTTAGSSSWAGTVRIGTRIIFNGDSLDWDTFNPEASQTLQEVCDLDNFTTTDVEIGNTDSDPRIALKGSDGSITAKGVIKTNNRIELNAAGDKENNEDTFISYKADGSTTAVSMTGGGIITAIGDIIARSPDGKHKLALRSGNNGRTYLLNTTTSDIYIRPGNNDSAIFKPDLSVEFKGDVGIFGREDDELAFVIKDDKQSGKPVTFSVKANGKLDVKGTSIFGDPITGDTATEYKDGAIMSVGGTGGSYLQLYCDTQANSNSGQANNPLSIYDGKNGSPITVFSVTAKGEMTLNQGNDSSTRPGTVITTGYTSRASDGLTKLLLFKHGYWGGSQEVASIGVDTGSSSAGSGTGFGDIVFHTGSSGNGDGGSTSKEYLRLDSGGTLTVGEDKTRPCFRSRAYVYESTGVVGAADCINEFNFVQNDATYGNGVIRVVSSSNRNGTSAANWTPLISGWGSGDITADPTLVFNLNVDGSIETKHTAAEKEALKISNKSNQTLVDIYQTSDGDGNHALFRMVKAGGSKQIELKSKDGSAEFKGNVTVGGSPSSGGNAGSLLSKEGYIVATNADKDATIWYGFTKDGESGGSKNPTSRIYASGKAEFAGNIQAGNSAISAAAAGSVVLKDGGFLSATSTDKAPLWRGYKVGNTTPTSRIETDGSASFDKQVEAKGGIKFSDGTEQTTAFTAGGGRLTGEVIAYAGASAPSGWQECDGSTAATDALKKILGVDNVPDLRGDFVRGWDHGRGIDSGRTLLSRQDDTTRAPRFNAFSAASNGGHSHSTGTALQSSDDGSYDFNSGDNAHKDSVNTTNSTGSHGHSISGGDAETRPTNIALMYIIKT